MKKSDRIRAICKQIDKTISILDINNIPDERLETIKDRLYKLNDSINEFLNLANPRIEKIAEINKSEHEKLLEEIKRNDEILRKNTEERDMQIQNGLIRSGYPSSAPLWRELCEKFELEIKRYEIEIENKLKTIYPLYQHQLNDQWLNIQISLMQKTKIGIENNLREIKVNIDKVSADIDNQNERIKARREQIIEELKKLGHEYKE